MRLPQYESSEKIGSPARRISDVQIQSGGAQALIQSDAALSKTNGDVVGAAIAGFNQYREQVQVANVLEAKNYYNQLLTEGMNKLSQKKEGNALNVVAEYDKMQSDAMSRTEKRYKSYLYGQQGQAFYAAAGRDNVTKRGVMERYQMEETEKYTVTQTQNAIDSYVSDCLKVPSDMTMSQNAYDSIGAAVAAQYLPYGSERVKLEVRKSQGAFATTMANACISGGDFKGANQYLERWGASMDPQQRVALNKMIKDHEKRNRELTTFGAAYNNHRGDFAGYLQDIMNGAGASMGGDAKGALAHFKAMSDSGENWGVNTCTLGLNDALTAGGFQPINTWAPDAWAEAKENNTAFTDRAELRDGDIVYWNTDGDDASHVGMYDAKTGKVYQSGTNGFAPISLDEYEVTGFSHPVPEEQDPAQVEELQKQAIAYWNQQDAIIKKDSSDRLEHGRYIIEEAIRNNPSITADEVAGMVNSFTTDLNGDFDEKTYTNLMRYSDSLRNAEMRAARSGGSGGSRGGSSDGSGMYDSKGQFKGNEDVWATIQYDLKAGNTTPDDVMELMNRLDYGDEENGIDPHPLTPSARKRFKDILNAYDNSTGAFKPELGSLISEIASEVGYKTDKAAYMVGLTRAANSLNAQYAATHDGEDAPIDWMKESLLDAARNSNVIKTGEGLFFDSQASYSDIDLYRKGISYYEQNPDTGTYYVTDIHGKKHPLTGEEFETVMNDPEGILSVDNW